MNSIEAIRRVCQLPADFIAGGKSAHELVHEAGIDPASLNVESVAAVLASTPSLIDDWLRWSEDQRCTPSHFFTEEKNQFVVGRFPGNERVTYTDRIFACADFIVKQVNQIW